MRFVHLGRIRYESIMIARLKRTWWLALCTV